MTDTRWTKNGAGELPARGDGAAVSGWADTAVMSVATAAELLGISRSHAYELIRRKELPAVHLGRRVVVPYRGISALLAAATEPLAGW